jgi:hypothetical protein
MLELIVIQLKNVLFKREIKPQNIWEMDAKGFHDRTEPPRIFSRAAALNGYKSGSAENC